MGLGAHRGPPESQGEAEFTLMRQAGDGAASSDPLEGHEPWMGLAESHTSPGKSFLRPAESTSLFRCQIVGEVPRPALHARATREDTTSVSRTLLDTDPHFL